jgi:hypothetical protein
MDIGGILYAEGVFDYFVAAGAARVNWMDEIGHHCQTN